jgi:hypothetical protein
MRFARMRKLLAAGVQLALATFVGLRLGKTDTINRSDSRILSGSAVADRARAGTRRSDRPMTVRLAAKRDSSSSAIASARPSAIPTNTRSASAQPDFNSGPSIDSSKWLVPPERWNLDLGPGLPTLKPLETEHSGGGPPSSLRADPGRTVPESSTLLLIGTGLLGLGGVMKIVAGSWRSVRRAKPCLEEEASS